MMNVCEALLNVLSDYGVKYLFGIPGDAINELLEAVRKQNKIKFVHVFHEEAGALAASAQAKLSGELCACVGTAGPGAIHLLNGLYDAKMDGAPVIAITGTTETFLTGTSQMQEVNLNLLFSDVAVYNQTIIDAGQVPEIISLACQTALEMKGVSHISLPINIASQQVQSFKTQKHILKPAISLNPSAIDIKRAIEILSQAERPLILAGVGCQSAVAELIRLAEKLKAPITRSLRAKDLMDDEHPYSLGGTGFLGTDVSAEAMRNCDVLLVAGSDMPYSEYYPQHAKTIQIDQFNNHIGRRQHIDCALSGDVRQTFTTLINSLSDKSEDKWLRECQKQMSAWKNELKEEEDETSELLKPQMLARLIGDNADDNAVITCDTGCVTVWTARHFKSKGSQRFTISGKLASMGYALPAAIGAQLLYPKRQVIAICGDGGFAMLMSDFATAVKYELPLKVFIFNNGELGMIRMEQEVQSGHPAYQVKLHDIDYSAIAVACGAMGYRINTADAAESVIATALVSAGPCIVDARIDADEMPDAAGISSSEKLKNVTRKIKQLLIQ